MNTGTEAPYPGGGVGGYWSSGASSWSFVDGPQNRFHVLDNEPGPRGSPAIDGFGICTNFTGSALGGFAPDYLSITLFAYGAGSRALESTAPPVTVDLDAFAEAAGGGVLLLTFLSASNENVLLSYGLDSLTLTPAAVEVSEPATLGLALSGLLAALVGKRKVRSRFQRI